MVRLLHAICAVLAVISADAKKKKGKKKGAEDHPFTLAEAKEKLMADPNNAAVWEALGLAQLEVGRVEEAKMSFKQATKIDPALPSKASADALGAKTGPPAAEEAPSAEAGDDSAAAPKKRKKDKKKKKKKKQKKSVAVDVSADAPVEFEERVFENETVLWRSGDGEVPPIDGVHIYHPDEVSKISTVKIDPGNKKCGYEDFLVAYDKHGDVLTVAIDNFFSDKTMTDFKNMATGKKKITAKWEWAVIHKAMQPKYADDLSKGIGFPGLRKDVHQWATPSVVACLKPVMRLVDPNFNFKKTRDVQTLFGLLVPMENRKGQPKDVKWLDAQRIPHTDIRWELGTYHDATVPTCYASVLPLNTDFNNSGTGLWRETGSKYSLLKNVPMNELAQGNMNPNVPRRRHPELDVVTSVPDPHFHELKEHPWAEMVALVRLRFNRFALYDGRRLHQQYLEGPDYPRLSKDPKLGRLTMNSFFWNDHNSPQPER